MTRHDVGPIIRAALFFALACGAARVAGAQTLAVDVEPMNPAALEVRVPGVAVAQTRFEIELLPADAAAGGNPVRTSGPRTGTPLAEGSPSVRVDIADLFTGLQDGAYVARVRLVDSSTRARASATSTRFTVAGYAPAANETRRESERFWTRVAIAVAGGLLLIPLLIR